MSALRGRKPDMTEYMVEEDLLIPRRLVRTPLDGAVCGAMNPEVVLVEERDEIFADGLSLVVIVALVGGKKKRDQKKSKETTKTKQKQTNL